MTRNLETDALTTAKGVKEFLAIGLELVLVVHIYYELLALEDIGNAVRLGVVCYEPVNETQTHFTRSFQKFNDFIQILATAVKTLEMGDNKFLFAVNLLFSCLRIRCYSRRLFHGDSML